MTTATSSSTDLSMIICVIMLGHWAACDCDLWGSTGWPAQPCRPTCPEPYIWLMVFKPLSHTNPHLLCAGSSLPATVVSPRMATASLHGCIYGVSQVGCSRCKGTRNRKRQLVAPLGHAQNPAMLLPVTRTL